MGKMPMFEPADSQECVDMMKEAYEVSEKYGAVVIMRIDVYKRQEYCMTRPHKIMVAYR